MRSRVAILLLVLSFSQSMAQEDAIQLKIDSLLALITPNMSDTAKANIYHKIGATSDNIDTTIKHASLSNALCYEKNYDHISSINYAQKIQSAAIAQQADVDAFP